MFEKTLAEIVHQPSLQVVPVEQKINGRQARLLNNDFRALFVLEPEEIECLKNVKWSLVFKHCFLPLLKQIRHSLIDPNASVE